MISDRFRHLFALDAALSRPPTPPLGDAALRDAALRDAACEWVAGFRRRHFRDGPDAGVAVPGPCGPRPLPPAGAAISSEENQ